MAIDEINSFDDLLRPSEIASSRVLQKVVSKVLQKSTIDLAIDKASSFGWPWYFGPPAYHWPRELPPVKAVGGAECGQVESR